MKSQLVKSIAATLALSTGIVTLGAVAMHGEEHDMHKRGEHMAEMLKLDEGQRALFDKMHASHGLKEDRRARKDHRQALAELAKKASFDEAEAKVLADNIGREVSSQALEHASALHSFYNSLNEEQKTTFNALHEVRRAKFDSRMERMSERGERNEKRHEMHH